MSQTPVAPEKWKRNYPMLDGTSPLGPFFIPDEKSSYVRLQLFEQDEFVCHWTEMWIELKGHCVEVYEEQEAKDPTLVFDLKETQAFLAAKGLPGSSPDLTSGRIALFSRYYMNKAVGNNCFFFEFPSPQDGKAWLSSILMNREWALRHSALMHPLGSCQVFGEMYEGKVVVRKRFSNTTMTKCAELHAVGLTEGKIEKLGGSRLEGRFQTREIMVKDGERLEYSADGGVKGDIVLAKASVVMVCNDVLTKSKARKKPKPSEAMEHVNWFGVIGEGDNRLFVFRTPESDVAERWCVSLAALSSVDKQKISQLIQLKVDQAKKNPARKVRYVGHPLAEPFYPVVPREDGGAGKAATLAVPKAGAGDPRRKSDQPMSGGGGSGGDKTRPVSSISPRGALPVKPGGRGDNSNNDEEDAAPISSSPRTAPNAAKAVRGPAAAKGAAKVGAAAATAGKGTRVSAAGAGAAAAAVAEPVAAETSFQKLRRATVALKSAAEARGAVTSVKGGPEQVKKASGPSQKEMEEVQKAEMRRLAALERKKLREERERLKGSEGDDGSSGGGGGGGGEGGASAAELEALKAQLEGEVERRAAAEAALEKLKEKFEADKATARELKQLAKDYRSKFDEASKEVLELKGELEEAHARESMMQEEHEQELASARTHSVAAAAGEDNDEVVAQLQDELASLSEQLSKAKNENRAQAKEVRDLRAAIETLEADKDKLMEENDLLLGEVAQAEEMQEAVEGILALGDPAELVAQLEELLVENEALTAEVATLKKRVGAKK